MKKVQYTFEVPDFCPDECEAFNPFRGMKREKMTCLYESQCRELRRAIEMNAELGRILASAGGASPSPTRETEAGDGES